MTLSPLRIFSAAALMLLSTSALRAAESALPASSGGESAADIRTPAAPATPRINGARVFGARPGSPFFFHVPATGDRPMTFTAEGLPAGLSIDAASGNITGSVAEAGSHPVTLTATNAKGKDSNTLNIVIGDTICLTPPMGWNSWNHFAGRVSDKVLRDTADTMVATGLIDHGWTYINVDDCWQGDRDANGRIQGNEKFPDMKALCDYVHSKGLKFGTYSSPGPKTCAHFTASYQHEDQDAQTYADWGVDYVKYDWCSYNEIAASLKAKDYAAKLPSDQAAQLIDIQQQINSITKILRRLRTPEQVAKLKDLQHQAAAIISHVPEDVRKQIDLDNLKLPYKQFGESLAKTHRDIVYSLCQYGMGDVWEWGAEVGGNCWRTTGDIDAEWKSICRNGFSQNGHEKFAAPGHWNDPDMLEIGNKGLTPDECYTHMTLWCILASPLLIGCDMTKMDAVTASIFANDEVIAVDQDALGKQGYRLKEDGNQEVWIKPLAGGAIAVGLFNRGESPAKVAVSLADLKLTGSQPLRDLWRQKDLAPTADDISATVAPHSAELFRVGAPAK